MNKSNWKRVGTIGVDSGQMMLVDPCYALVDDAEVKSLRGGNGIESQIKISEQVKTYEKLLEVYGDDYNVDTIEYADGIICSTGYGDGSYDVFIKTIEDGTWGHRVAEMKIVFIEDHKEEDYA